MITWLQDQRGKSLVITDPQQAGSLNGVKLCPSISMMLVVKLSVCGPHCQLWSANKPL